MDEAVHSFVGVLYYFHLVTGLTLWESLLVHSFGLVVSWTLQPRDVDEHRGRGGLVCIPYESTPPSRFPT